MTTAEKNGQAESEFRRKYQEADENYRVWATRRAKFREEAERHGFRVDADDDDIRFSTAYDFIEEHPTLAEPVIDGLCRRGETVNVIGSTKEGKSWLILQMALSIATGRPWMGRETLQGKVALIDNELQPATLSSRLRTVARAMTIPEDVLADDVLILSLRGRLRFINELVDPIEKITDQGVVMVGLDAFYRFVPTGASENDNTAMAKMYNAIDELARKLDATFVLNHHSSKGDQTGKRVTDVGSGAGSISRAADTHLILREHQETGLSVLDAACRSFPPNEPSSMRFDFPLWMPSDEEPELKRPKTRCDAKQESDDAKGREAILKVLQTDGELIRSAVRTKTGMGADRCNRLLRGLLDDGLVEVSQRENPRNKSDTADYFRAK